MSNDPYIMEAAAAISHIADTLDEILSIFRDESEREKRIVSPIDYERSLTASLLGVTQGFVINLEEVVNENDAYKKATKLRSLLQLVRKIQAQYERQLDELPKGTNHGVDPTSL